MATQAITTNVTYNLSQDWSGQNFFNGWDFYGSWDNLTLSMSSHLVAASGRR